MRCDNRDTITILSRARLRLLGRDKLRIFPPFVVIHRHGCIARNDSLNTVEYINQSLCVCYLLNASADGATSRATDLLYRLYSIQVAAN